MTYVISDLHGYWDKYREMLCKIDLRDPDTLYVLGDVIDRGPDGLKILRDMTLRPNVIGMLGNHELSAAVCLPALLKEVTEKSLAELDAATLAGIQEWLQNGAAPTLREFRDMTVEERKDILEYLREMTAYEEVEIGGRSFLLVHAGLQNFSPDRALDDYHLEELLFGRPDPNTSYFEDRYLIFGHTPTRDLFLKDGLPPRDAIYQRGKLIGIDCGSVFGGKLGCLCLETMEAYYV